MTSLSEGFKMLAIGGEGSGKTFAQWQLAKKERYLIALEIHGDPIFKEVDAYVQTPRQFMRAIREYWKAMQKGVPYRITWCVGDTREHIWILEFVIEQMKRAGGGALFIDESETFIPSNKELADWAFQLAKHSRHLKIKSYLTAHKPTELHNKFRTNVTRSLYFFAKDKLTLGHIYTEESIFHKPLEIRNLLKSLGKYEYLLSEKGQPLKKMKKITLS